MTNSTQLFDLAQLAEASYAEFNLFANNSTGTIAALKARGFSDSQATEFADNWRVVHHQPNQTGLLGGQITGYSGTLFEYIGNDPNSGFTTGQYIFAPRGTEPDYIINSSDLAADVGDIVIDGLAFEQVIDMYNHWKQITTASGQSYQRAVLLQVNGSVVYPPSSYIVDQPTGTTYAIVFVDSATSYPANDPRSLGLGINVSSQGLTLTGHSLGGHLATAFTRLFAGTEGVITINGAGFPTGSVNGLSGNASQNIQNLFTTLGGGNGFGAIQNIYGDKMPEIVTMNGPNGLVQQGTHDSLFIESGSASNTFGHSSSQMTDSLAVADLFIQLDASFATQTPAQALATLNALFEKGSNQAAQSLEKLVIGLSETLLGTKPTLDTDDREDLYVAIKALTDSATFQALIGKVTIVTPPTSASEARNDLGLFLSLYYLTPFALKTDGSIAADAQLTIAHPDLATQFKDDKLLTPEQIANNEANFSDMWLADRAAMLSWKNLINEKDFVATNALGYSSPGAASQIFEDPNTRIVINGSIGNERNIKFGADTGNNINDTLAGGTKNDNLYGMGGNDIVNGGDGNDYIEGNAGQDALNGGEGNDILIGGTEVDILDGGEGNDQLKGGAGADVYKLSGTYGTDTITDSDGVGIITVDNVALTGGTQVADHIYRNESLKYTYILAGSGETQSLFIQKDNSDNKIIIRNWTTANNLNITLQDQAIEEKPKTLGGDLETTKTHYKTSNKKACNPHGYWVTGLPLFNQNTQKTASNDKVNFAAGEREAALGYNEWRIAA